MFNRSERLAEIAGAGLTPQDSDSYRKSRFGGFSPEPKEQIFKIDSIDSIARSYKKSLTASKLNEIFGDWGA